MQDCCCAGLDLIPWLRDGLVFISFCYAQWLIVLGTLVLWCDNVELSIRGTMESVSVLYLEGDES